ncbi:MAG: hypothetical protein JSW61_02810 [Candidatus Thorarchaeota archaeon]|nr:MAG: hypothetical protein JSW61_02810 [Candidatus Thorarchaeota archaeon]
MRRKRIEQALIIIFLLFALIAGQATSAEPIEHGFTSVDHGVWIQMNPEVSPPNRTDTYFVYDIESDVAILFGGCIARDLLETSAEVYEDRTLNDTWVYDFNSDTWTEMSPTISPGPRGTASMAYDTESDRVVLFSGIRQINEPMYHVNWQETWTYDYNSNNWTNMEPTTMPPPRGFSSMAYDVESDVIILFGGVLNGGAPTSGTWAYDLNNNNWTNMRPSPHPTSRFISAMTYDVESDRVILFGGAQGGISPRKYTDTWAYDFNTNTWTNMNPIPNPPSEPYDMTYDVNSDLCIFFGGTTDVNDSVPSDETWAYDYNYNTWTNLNVSSRPGARGRPYLTYDDESDRILMYGGYGPERYNQIYNDTWAFDFLGFPTTAITTDPPPVGGIDPAIAAASVAMAAVVTTAYVVFSRKR